MVCHSFFIDLVLTWILTRFLEGPRPRVGCIGLLNRWGQALIVGSRSVLSSSRRRRFKFAWSNTTTIAMADTVAHTTLDNADWVICTRMYAITAAAEILVP